MKRWAVLLLMVAMVLTLFGGCAKDPQPSADNPDTSGTETTAPAEEDATEDAPAEVRSIVVGLVSGYKPYTFVDESGNSTGYDVEVLRKIDELLPEYEFTFEAVDKTTLLLGLETGKYQVALDGFLYTEERAEKFLFTENRLGASIETIIVREDETDIASMEDLVGRKLAPISASSNFVSQVRAFNEEHPDGQIEYTTVEAANRADTYQKIRDGVYDAFFDIKQTFDALEDEMKAGVKTCGTIGFMDTYPLLNKDEAELCTAIDEALATLRDDGTLSELSIEWFGEDIFVS